MASKSKNQNDYDILHWLNTSKAPATLKVFDNNQTCPKDKDALAKNEFDFKIYDCSVVLRNENFESFSSNSEESVKNLNQKDKDSCILSSANSVDTTAYIKQTRMKLRSQKKYNHYSSFRKNRNLLRNSRRKTNKLPMANKQKCPISINNSLSINTLEKPVTRKGNTNQCDKLSETDSFISSTDSFISKNIVEDFDNPEIEQTDTILIHPTKSVEAIGFDNPEPEQTDNIVKHLEKYVENVNLNSPEPEDIDNISNHSGKSVDTDIFDKSVEANCVPVITPENTLNSNNSDILEASFDENVHYLTILTSSIRREESYGNHTREQSLNNTGTIIDLNNLNNDLTHKYPDYSESLEALQGIRCSAILDSITNDNQPLNHDESDFEDIVTYECCLNDSNDNWNTNDFLTLNEFYEDILTNIKSLENDKHDEYNILKSIEDVSDETFDFENIVENVKVIISEDSSRKISFLTFEDVEEYNKNLLNE